MSKAVYAPLFKQVELAPYNRVFKIELPRGVSPERAAANLAVTANIKWGRKALSMLRDGKSIYACKTA